MLFSRVLGDGNQSVVILHGIFGTGDNWQSLAKYLSQKFSVHILDVRNHGKSFHNQQMNYPIMAEDVIFYLDQKGIKNCSIIGHSMGGKIAMQAILDHPNHFNKAIVIDIAPKKYTPQHNEVLLALNSLDLASLKKRSDIHKILNAFIKNEAVIQWIMKSIYSDDGSYKFRFNLSSISANYPILSDSIIPSKNQSCLLPTLFIKGENSDYIEIPNDLISIESHFPNYTLSVIQNAAHWVHVDNPIDLYSTILDFL
jgi:esterase